MTLSIGQFQYNGLAMGPGTAFQWNTIQGLTGLPAVRTGNVPRPNDQGMLAGYDYTGERTVTFNLEVTATQGGNTMQENLALARNAFSPLTSLGGGVAAASTTKFIFNLGEGNGAVGVNRYVVSRCEKFEDSVDLAWSAGGFQAGLAKVAVQLSATDPRIYDATTQTSTVSQPAASAGWTFPWTFNWTFAAVTGNLVTAVNNGGFACPAYITVAGPCLNPRIENQTTGVTLELDLQLNTGDTLMLDCYAGSAILNGQAERLNALAAGTYINTMLIQPGTNQVAFYTHDAVSTGATMTLNWANTWI